MLFKRQLCLIVVTFNIIICALSLPFIFSSKANALTINGSSQTPVGQSQTLSVSGGSGDYTWTIVGGAGSFPGGTTTTTGVSVTFNAPSSNQGCSGNTSVAVTDSTGQYAVTTIASNAYNGGTAYYINQYCQLPVHLCTGANPYMGGTPTGCGNVVDTPANGSYCAGCTAARFKCDDRYSTWSGNGDTPDWYTWITGDGGTCNNYPFDWVAGCFAEKCEKTQTIVDVRTPTMIAYGCCPSGSLSGNDGTNSKGDPPCQNIPANSTANLKSGNLYHDQEVGKLTLSYNSIDTYDGPLGKKWTHNYDLKLTAVTGNATLILKTEDGNVIYFHLSGSVYYPDAISGDTSQIVKNANNTYTRTLKNGTIQQYNTAGLLTSITDRNSNTTTLTYSGGNLASITDQNNRTTTITTTSGKITAITDPLNRTYSLTYTNGLLTVITDPLSNTWHYTYDTAGRMLTKVDPLNNTITYTYDSSGRLLTSTDPENKKRTMNYTYTASGTTTFTEKDGGIWTYTYDPAFTVRTSQTDPLGNVTRYAYDLKRNMTKITYPDNTTKTYTYDANSNMTSETDQLNHTTNYTYNSLNLVTSKTDPRGNTTSYTYSTSGNLLTITDPANGVTSFQYDTKGNPTSITDPRGKITTLAYDTQNNLTSMTNPLGQVTSFTYDAVGNMLTITDPLNNVTTYTYNNLNQMTQATDPRSNNTQYQYNYKGNITRITDAGSNQTNYAYNYRGQATQITDALNNITQMTYGPSGCTGCGGAEKLAALTDALNHATTYTYDTAGRLVTETDPLTRNTTYAYNSRSLLTSKTKPDSRAITYVYDATGRILEKDYPDSTVTTYSYDANGNMLTAANQNISYTFTYDVNNRLTGVTDSFSRSVTYQYDAAGNRTSMTTPDGLTTTYTYNDANRLTGISNFAGSFTFTYDNAGRRIQLANPNGTTAAYSYDANGNLTLIRHTDSGNNVISENSYTYNSINNRITKNTTTYTYDTISRLTNTTGEDYTYDGVGNRLTGPNTTDTMSYNAGNEQQNINATQFTYDANGNRIQKTEGGVTTTYTFDDENRLIQITKGTDTIIYAYDPFGRRIAKTVNGTMTRYVYDGNTIVAEYNNLGNVAARYAHSLNIDEPLAVQQGSATSFYHANGLGSIVALTNAAGSVVQTYSYDSFGNITQSGSITQPFTYTAREYDSETGLYFYRARYYDPKAGRFITKDTISFAGGDVNLYNYVQNNPVNFKDPLGLWRMPDYFSANINVAIPNPVTGTIVGWSGTASIDRYGNWYWSPLGGGVGKSATFVSGSATANWMNQPCKPSEKQLNNFLTGHGFNVTGGYWGGASESWSPGNGSATGLGFVTPQAGGSYNYSFQGPGNTGLNW